MDLSKTSLQYDEAIALCRDIFIRKTSDYGTAWRILRTSSLTDQIFIKASRIRSIEELKGASKIDEGVKSEYIGIVNYSIMALIQLDKVGDDDVDMLVEEVSSLYDKYVEETKSLMMDKNHDYGEAWRDMRISSITDLILMKTIRTKSIEDNNGETLISEGLDANYMDMLNYAVFALIKLEEQKTV